MIAIKGMEEIPKHCEDCPLCSEYDGECGVVGYDPKADITKERMKECPLTEIVTCKDCDYCRFELVEGIPYYWCDKDNCPTSENFYCGNAERRE